ncbi:MAG TPA: rhodanese-like domain-containing protein [Terriglobales bacterium]|nr:rhodanese-like domain-containing protein [Terriglobales bacterium]
MYLEQFYLGCLAHASYMLGSETEAVVVDPQRDVDLYLQAAEEHGLIIRHIFETHLHADFVSGHKELAARTGAQIYFGASAGATFPHVAVPDGFELRFGQARINVLETPGHTPESICLLVTDNEKAETPQAVLTGDTLFLGDVGRPDLSRTHTPEQLAGMLYDSLHNKLMKLPDEVLVYPAHGAGSLCGRNMRAERSSTIGTERLTNYALQIRSREEFVKQLTSNLPARPDYFLQDAEINRGGASSLSEMPELKAIAPAELKVMLEEEEGVMALDIRPGDQFVAGHVPGSVNIALSGQFATWAGTILGLSSPPVLIADSPEQLAEARLRLARVGIEAERGYLQGGVRGWKQAGFDLAQLPEITAQELQRRLSENTVRALDVRREPEWMAGHVAGAAWWPLDRFRVSPPEIDLSLPLAVHCQSGYRSMIACSLLQRAGFKNVINVAGGFAAWQEAQLPVATGASQEV